MSVILMVASESHFDHVRSLMVACRRQGSWRGDFALMVPKKSEVSDFLDRNIWITKAPEPDWTNKIKFRIFAPVFTQWSMVLYLDLDCLIQGDLNIACEQMASKFPKILTDSPQDTTVLEDWIHFDPCHEKHAELYERLKTKHPCVMKQVRTSDAMLFDPRTIPEWAMDKMFAIQEEFKELNPGEYDQQVIDLVLYDQMEPMGKDFCTWWAFDEPGNRVANPALGWRGDERPAIVHYWGAFAPWLEKAPQAGAYYNERLGRVCRELYLENLSLFDEMFPYV